MNNLLLFSLYYSSTDMVSTIMGLIFIILIGIFCCSALTGDDQSSKSNYKSNSHYRSNSSSNRYYDEDELNYNWDDSWDDKWLHQGEYADVVDTPTEEYTDYDPSWDEGWRD